MNAARNVLGLALLTAIVGLTLATAYIHFWVGGTMLLLNAAGYLALAVLVVGSALRYRRALPLLLMALAGYAAATIVGWAVMGPYFDVAYLAKAIELVLIGLIAIQLLRTRVETGEAIRWAGSHASATLGMLPRRASSGSVPAARGEE